MWRHFCEQHISAASTTYDALPAANTLLAYSACKSYKELCVRLRAWQALPVGLWWRNDATTHPHGQLLVATASGSGQWAWFPLLHNGHALWDTPLAVTDLRDTACVRAPLACLRSRLSCALQSCASLRVRVTMQIAQVAS